jgi:hypothetical protein
MKIVIRKIEPVKSTLRPPAPLAHSIPFSGRFTEGDPLCGLA